MATQTARITPASFSFHDITAGQDQGVISPEEHKSENDSRKLLDDADQLKYNADSERKGVASLSCWLKPPSSAGGSQSDTEGKVVKQRCYENSVFTDLPIFTASGLNWDNDKPTPVLPKVWDGNGIPNTTTKYKEVNTFIRCSLYLALTTYLPYLHCCFAVIRTRKSVGTQRLLRKG
jgi:hypothetical protein